MNHEWCLVVLWATEDRTGGGSQFGVVVEFVFKLYPSEGPYGSGILAYKGQEIENVIKIIQVYHHLERSRSIETKGLKGLEDDTDSPGTIHLSLLPAATALSGIRVLAISAEPILTPLTSLQL